MYSFHTGWREWIYFDTWLGSLDFLNFVSSVAAWFMSRIGIWRTFRRRLQSTKVHFCFPFFQYHSNMMPPFVIIMLNAAFHASRLLPLYTISRSYLKEYSRSLYSTYWFSSIKITTLEKSSIYDLAYKNMSWQCLSIGLYQWAHNSSSDVMVWSSSACFLLRPH